MRKKKRWKAAALSLVAAITAILPIASGSGGTIFKDPTPLVAYADGGAYNKLAVDLATATAFDDARNAIKSASSEDIDEMETNFYSNLSVLCSNRFGNVGLFVGPKGSSSNADITSTLFAKVSIDNAQIEAYDNQTSGAFSKYKAFGGAVQKLNSKAQKANGSSSSIQKGLDELSAAGAKLTNLGAELLAKYNPAPLVLSMFDANELNTHPDNKLVALVNGSRDMRELFTILGVPTRFGVPLSFLILFFAVFLLFITSFLMTLINGRSAGEHIRKMMVKVLIGSIAVPLIAKGLDAGIGLLGTISVTQANSPEANYVEQNLNFADWYACGFSLPSGTSLAIDKNGEFVLTPNDVRAINTFTYSKIWGTPSDRKMMEKMEEYFTQYKAMPMAVNFSEPTTQSGGRAGRPWRTKNFYEALDNFGTNELLTNELEFDESGSNPELANIGYFASNRLSMSGGNGSWVVSGSGTRYGISPIAATNLMRTTFTGSAMTVNSNSTMGGVVFGADNGVGTTTTQMPSLVRFLATFSMVLAAMKGLFTILSAGFAGVLSGGMKSATGSSAGFGQAIGGVIALVGGVFGISVIMTLSFTLVDQLYGIMQNLISGTTAGNDILQPIREVFDGIPILGPIIGDFMKSVSRFILSILCMLTFPKFGGIPVTLFCQYLSELPSRMAEQAQQIENRFTGDFRGGGGGFHGGGMQSANQMVAQAAGQGKEQMKGVGQGLSMAAGAIGGLAATTLGNHLANKYAGADTGENGQGGSLTDASDAMTGATEPETGDTDPISTDPIGTEDTTGMPEAGSMDSDPQSGESESGGDTDSASIEDTGIPDYSSDSGFSMSPDATDGHDEIVQSDASYQEGDSMSSDKEVEDSSETEDYSDTQTFDNDDSVMDHASAEYATDRSMSQVDQEHNDSIQSEQFGSDQSLYESQEKTDVAGADHDVLNQQSSMERSMSQNDTQGVTNAEHSLSNSEHAQISNNSQLHTNASTKSLSNNHASNQSSASASVRTSSHSSLGNGKGGSAARNAASGSHSASMNGRQTGPRPNASRPDVNGTAALRTPGGKAPRISIPPKSQSGGTQAMSTDKRTLTAQQRHNRNMQAVAKGLQAFGNNTTKGQAAAGVAAGLAHTAGSAMGVGHMTGKGVQAVRNNRQRQNDIRDGLAPNYSRQQEMRNQAAQNEQAARQNEREQSNWEHSRDQQIARRNSLNQPNAVRQQQMYSEELAREAEYRAARRPEHDSRS